MYRPVLILLAVLLFVSCKRSDVLPARNSVSVDTTVKKDTTTGGGGGGQNLPAGVGTLFGSNSGSWIMAMQSSKQSLSLEGLYNNKVATDLQGNIYVFYNFYGVLDIDPSASVLLEGSNADQATLVKYDASGKLLWSKPFIAGSGSYVVALATDAAGNVYCTVTCYGAATLQFGSNSYSTRNPNSTEFIKFSGSGDLQWLRETSGSRVSGMTVDAVGNVYISGSLSGDATFYRAPADTVLTYSSSVPAMYYWARFNSDGNFINASTVVRAETTLSGAVVDPVLAADPAGNIYMAGTTPDIGLMTGFPAFFGDSEDYGGNFLAKYGKDGGPVWVRGYFITNGLAKMEEIVRARTDPAGNVYVLGRGLDSQSDLLCKVDGNSNDIWHKTITTGLAGGFLTLGTNAQNEVFVSGDFAVKPSDDVANGNVAVFFNKYSAVGAAVSAKSLPGYSITSYIGLYDAALDNNNNITIVGYFSGSIKLLNTSADPNHPYNDFYNSFFIAHFPE